MPRLPLDPTVPTACCIPHPDPSSGWGQSSLAHSCTSFYAPTLGNVFLGTAFWRQRVPFSVCFLPLNKFGSLPHSIRILASNTFVVSRHQSEHFPVFQLPLKANQYTNLILRFSVYGQRDATRLPAKMSHEQYCRVIGSHARSAKGFKPLGEAGCGEVDHVYPILPLGGCQESHGTKLRGWRSTLCGTGPSQS